MHTCPIKDQTSVPQTIRQRSERAGLRLGAAVLAGLLGLVAASTATAEIPLRGAKQPVQPANMTAQQAAARLTDAVRTQTARHMLVQFADAVTPEERADLQANGVTLQQYVGNNAWFARVDAEALQTDAIGGFDKLQFAGEIEREYKMHPILSRGETVQWSVTDERETQIAGRAVVEPIVAAYVLFHKDVEGQVGRDIIEAHQGAVIDELNSVNGVVVELPRSQIDALAQADEVQWIEPPLPRLSTMNAENRVVTQAETVQDTPYDLDGTGVNVLVFDAGYAFDDHSDFGDRLTTQDNSGLSNHATHVAGTVAGDGSASNGEERGMAPNATVVSYGFEIGGTGVFLFSNPADIELDYEDAINTHGAVLANNSIGTNTATNGFPCEITGDYGVTSTLIDSIVRGSLGNSIKIVWANGNERQSSNCGDTFFTTAPPATAKNHFTVGALNANDNSVTSFTSWGPTDDGRIKPDIAAPGCQNGTFGSPPNEDDDGGVRSTAQFGGYTTLCGTSMASPTVCGLGALLVQDYRQQFPDAPEMSAALMKALFIQNAADLENTGPDYKTGFGLAQIKDSIDHMRTGNFIEGMVDQNESFQAQIDIPSGFSGPANFTLVWSDAPGVPNSSVALVNDLDLLVTGPGGEHLPWTLDPENPDAPAVRTQADHVNNIEKVTIDNPQAGTYTITVTGFNVPEGPQPFALALDGAPVNTQITFPNGVPEVIAPGEPTTVTAQVTATGEDLVSGSVELHVRTDPGDSFDVLAMSNDGDELFTADLPAAACDDQVEFFVQAEGATTGIVANPGNAPAVTHQPLVGEQIVVFDDNFETDLGWTVTDSPGLTTGTWQRVTPLVPGDRGEPTFDADGSGQCYVTDNANDEDIDDGSTTLTSPIIDASSLGEQAVVSYYRWYSNNLGDGAFQDVFVVEISDDAGASWTTLETVGPDGPEVVGGQWHFKQFALTDVPGVDITNQMRLRFIAEDAEPGSVVEAAVDGVTFSALDCDDPEPICPADIADGGDGNVGVSDLLALLSDWGAAGGPADLNDDNVVNVADLLELLGQWGPCPG